jgi:hypothetical protein
MELSLRQRGLRRFGKKVAGRGGRNYSYPEDSNVARLDLLGLREHRDGIGSQQPHCG